MITREIIVTSFGTLGYVFSNVAAGRKTTVSKCLMYFVVTWALLFAFDSLYSQECDWEISERNIFDNFEFNQMALTQQQKDVYKQLSEDYFRQGIFYLDCAQKRSLLIPDDNLRDLCHDAISVAVTSATAKNISAFAVQSIVLMIGTYLHSVWENYQWIELDLLRSSIYFEQSSFFQTMIRCDGQICPKG